MEEIIIQEMSESDLKYFEKYLISEFDEFWSFNILKQDFNNDNTYYFVAKQNDEIVGFAGLMIIIDEANIMNIVTKKVKRNLGIGSKLLENLIQFSKEKNQKSITLEVDEQNNPAIKLYEKYNFKIVGKRKNYYHNNNDALLMTLFL